jgi:hypothetical protein
MKQPTQLPSWPRLFIEKTEGAYPDDIGFLQLSSDDTKIKIGKTTSREFRLLQCLFNPQNFPNAKYSPVTQTYERLFAAIGLKEDATNELLKNHFKQEHEQTAIVEETLEILQKKLSKSVLSLTNTNSRVLLTLIP